MKIKKPDIQTIKNAYQKGKKVIKETLDNINEKADPIVSEFSEKAKKVLQEPKVKKLERKQREAFNELSDAQKKLKDVIVSKNFRSEFLARKDVLKKNQAHTDALRKYENFYARQSYAQQEFERINRLNYSI